MNLRLGAAAVGVLAFGLAASGASRGETRPHSSDPLDWIIQHVCADAADKPVPADPYDGCPAGTHERRLKIGDPMPYLRHDLPGKNGDHPHGYQRHDAYPLTDVHYGGVVSANDYDFDYVEPYGAMHPGDGDGFDVYRVYEGNVSGGGTRDGSGFSQTFFGPECKPFGGWVLFPVGFLTELRPGATGRGHFARRDSYWEQNGVPYPGRCEHDKAFFSADALTTWTFETDHHFGGVNGAREKLIDAIVSTHGLPSSPETKHGYHLERFYFTDLYGLTRWEAWKPSKENPKVATSCGDRTETTYEGIAFTLTNCREWSVADINDPPRVRLPWPYPEANLLKNWHFDENSLAPWATAQDGGPAASPLWRTLSSQSTHDLRFSKTKAGVKYLQIDCTRSSCGAKTEIYQDVPVGDIASNHGVDYGFSGAIGDEGGGSLTVTLSQRDSAGHTLWSDSFEAPMTNSYRNRWASDSVYLASRVFLKHIDSLPVMPHSATVRISLSPRSPKTYNILDSWLISR